jgi:methylmalonyl-CoA/ethylmalonyl-CoA epimerase
MMIFALDNFSLHHIGCLTKSIDESLIYYTKILPLKRSGEIITIQSQGVKVCFLSMNDSTFLELVEPSESNKTLNNLLKKGISFYHLGYLSENVEDAADFLVSKEFKLVTSFYSEAFQNKKCIFLLSPEFHLIELIQK